ncbi:MAG: aminoglycoside phosphotransferase family protein [Patescibacteria group bacterium]
METAPQQPAVLDEEKSAFERVDLKQVAVSINEYFPNIKTENIVPLGEGTHSWTFLVNDEYVFRFAQTPVAAENLKREMVMLPILKEYVTLPIPDFEYVALDMKGLGFSGYKCIQGGGFSRRVIASLTSEELAGVQADLKEFFDEVHSIPIELALEAGVRDVDSRKRVERVRKKALPAIADLFTQDEVRYFEKVVDDFLADERNFIYEKTFLHGDVNRSNLRFDETKRRVSGVIDWGEMQIGDPLFDLVRPYFWLGKEFVEPMLAHLPDEEYHFSVAKIHKMAVFLSLGAIHYMKDTYGKEAAIKRVEILRKMSNL